MSKSIIITVIVNPFWAWMFLLLCFGLLGCLFGLAWGWLFCPRYISVARYNVRRKANQLHVRSSSHTKSSRKAVSLFQRLVRFRKKLQPVVEIERWCEWKECSRFRRGWHHKKYRSFVRREYGVKLPKGKVIVYCRRREFAVLHRNTYYIIPWK